MENETKETELCYQGPNMSGAAHNAFAQWPIRPEDVELLHSISTQASLLWDKLDAISIPPGNSQSGRMVALAKTKIEEVVMWATKAISRYSDGQTVTKLA